MTEKNDTESNLIVKTVRISKKLAQELEKIAKKHHRSFNGELITAIENHTTEYNKDWRNKH